MKILVIEDNPDMADSLREILEMEGCAVELAVDGTLAAKAFEPGRYDLILMDLKLPGMRGRELIQHLLGKDPKARIIVLTGNSVKEEVDEVSRLPIQQVLRKPYDPEILVNLLKRYSSPG